MVGWVGGFGSPTLPPASYSSGVSGSPATFDSTLLGMTGGVGYWKMEEASGAAADAIGSNPGAYIASPTLHAAGPFAGSFGVTLNGTSQCVRVPDAATLDLGNSLSFGIWAKRARTATDEVLGSKGPNAWHLGLNGSGPPDGIALVRTGVVVLTTTASLANDTASWHLFIGVKSGTTVKIYYDGADVTGVVDSTDTLTNTADDLEFGHKVTDGASWFAGTISRAFLFNRALTGAEVTTLYSFHP